MYLKKSNYIKDIYLEKEQKVDFGSIENANVKVTLRPLTERERKIGLGFVVCQALTKVKVNSKNEKIFANLEINKYSKLKNDLNGHTAIKRNMQEYIVPNLDFFPDYFQDFISNSNQKLSNAILNTVQTIRWVYNVNGQHNPIYSYSFNWSRDLKIWNPVPDGLYFKTEPIYSISLRKEKNITVSNLLNQNINEPEYHILFRESWKQINSNPRSSIVIGVAALEIAVKDCIQKLAPKTRWLMENLPSPPVEKLLKEYLPLISNEIQYGDKIVLLSDRLLDEVRKVVFIRNKIVHRGDKAPELESIQSKLIAVKDILHIIDFFKGNKWAIDYISNETKSEVIISK